MPATTADLLKAASKAAANQQLAQQTARATAAAIATATGHGVPAPVAPSAPVSGRARPS